MNFSSILNINFIFQFVSIIHPLLEYSTRVDDPQVLQQINIFIRDINTDPMQTTAGGVVINIGALIAVSQVPIPYIEQY